MPITGVATHSASLLYRLAHHVPRIWAQLYELVESVGPDGMCADWLELPYPCGRACPPGASRPAISGVYAAHETAHPLCAVTEDKAPSRSAYPSCSRGVRLGNDMGSSSAFLRGRWTALQSVHHTRGVRLSMPDRIASGLLTT